MDVSTQGQIRRGSEQYALPALTIMIMTITMIIIMIIITITITTIRLPELSLGSKAPPLK